MFPGKPQLLATGARILSVYGAAVGLLALSCLAVSPANAQDRSQGRSMVVPAAASSPANPAGVAGGRAILEQRRQRGRCGHRDQRRDGRRRADDERHRRRPLRDRLRREDRQTLWTERQRLGSRGTHDRVSEGQGHHARCREAGSTPSRCPAPSMAGKNSLDRFGTQEIRRRPRARHRLRRARISGAGVGRAVLGAKRRLPARRSKPPRQPICSTITRRSVGEIFRNPDLADSLRQHRAQRPRRVLQRRNRHEASSRLKRHGGTMTAHDLADYSSRVGRADLDHLSRLDGLRDAAQRPGNRRARNAQHHGEIPARRQGLGLRLRRRAARDDRGEEARLRRPAAIHRRSAFGQSSRRRTAARRNTPTSAPS